MEICGGWTMWSHAPIFNPINPVHPMITSLNYWYSYLTLQQRNFILCL